MLFRSINYLQYDGKTIKEVVGYVPTTSIGRKPTGGGSTYEDVNMLSALRKNTFLADGESVDYYLDAQELDTGVEVVVTVNDVIVENYTVDTVHGKITFDVAPGPPLTDGRDNVSVLFQKTVSEHRQRINGCTLLQVFDNRVFFSGNPDYPNVVWHSSLNDPTYCSDNDYYNEGLDLARVTGLVVGEDSLYVLKEPSQANTAVFYHKPVTDSAYGKIYPSTHSSIYTGCVGKCINFNDDVVFFSDRGMEAISGGITSEQMLAHRSTLIDSKLLTEENYKDMLLEEYEGYLMVFVDNKVYLADSRMTFANENHMEYEWFYWNLDKKVTSTRVQEGVLYIGTEDGIYTLSDMEKGISSYWTTPIDKFKHPQYLKTTNKKGCVVEAYGDVSILVKTDKSDWISIGNHKNVTDYLVCRIKQKKFKDIQMKFSSDTRFSLETATLECYIGGYIKR